MAALRDAWVKYKTSRELRQEALSFRAKFGVSVNGRFCPVRAFEEWQKIPRTVLKLELYDGDGSLHAFVTFNPMTLHVDKDIWNEAKIGEPRARYIVAHELGHLRLHSDQELHYTEPGTGRVSAPDEERSAENQAHIFAHFLLVGDGFMKNQRSSIDISIILGVSREILEAVATYDKSRDVFRMVDRVNYIGDSCGECGNFTLVRNGTCLKCDTCGSTTGCS